MLGVLKVEVEETRLQTAGSLQLSLQVVDKVVNLTLSRARNLEGLNASLSMAGRQVDGIFLVDRRGRVLAL